MSRKKTQKCISVRDRTYKKLRGIAESQGTSVSRLVDTAVIRALDAASQPVDSASAEG